MLAPSYITTRLHGDDLLHGCPPQGERRSYHRVRRHGLKASRSGHRTPRRDAGAVLLPCWETEVTAVYVYIPARRCHQVIRRQATSRFGLGRNSCCRSDVVTRGRRNPVPSICDQATRRDSQGNCIEPRGEASDFPASACCDARERGTMGHHEHRAHRSPR